jgi:hypothetical protein
MRIWIPFLSFLICQSANAVVSFRPQVGLGFTDNANYEDSSKDSDFFWWVRSSNTYVRQNSSWNLWLSYRGYWKEHQNDVLNYRLSDSLSLRNSVLGEFDWDIGAGGQKYSEGSPGTTENSFDNIYLETSLLKTWGLRSNLDFNLEPLYQYKYYPQFGGRADHSLISNFSFDWNFHPIQSLNPFAELGLVFSNQSLYSRNYLEFGSDWKVLPRPDLKYILHFSSRFTSFPSRKISESTVISDKKGRSRTQSQDETEAQSLIQIQASLVKMIEKAELKGSVAFNNQSSNSGYESYSEFQISASVLVPF